MVEGNELNIRRNKETEVNKIVEIWYEASLIAHDFIDKDFWNSQRKEMEQKYIPMSETYVICNGNNVVGFLSMVDNDLAALFIDVGHQGKGYGKALLSFIKRQRENIQLKVYKKNAHAVHFYLENGFEIKEKLLDEHTHEEEFLMGWKKS